MTTPLHQRTCAPLPKGTPALTTSELAPLLAQLPDWRIAEGWLERRFGFADFDATMAFVNAVAMIANAQDHHPDMGVRWGDCTLRWQTHSVAGLSLNDFICAARVDRIPAKSA